MNQSEYDQELAKTISGFYDDPLGYVLFVFPWGEKDTPLEPWDGPDTWQVDLLTRLGEEIKIRAFNGVDAVDPIRFAIASGHGVGKQLSWHVPFKRCIMDPRQLNEAIGMENIKWGDLQPGDYVFGADGHPTKIIATKRFVRPSYKVTFDDGSYTTVGAEHEWNVRGRQERRKGLDTWRTLETQEILKLGVTRPNGKAAANQWEIPVQGAVQFTHKEVYKPYTVGVWLGDGCSASGRITSTREELWERMGESPNRNTLLYKKNGAMYCTPSMLKDALKTNGMLPVTCDSKFVADEYKYNSEYVRREIVSGMLDTDGEVNHSGSIGYSSTSKQLVEDLIWLVRSLGGKAMMQPAVKRTFYTLADGSRSHDCKPCYRCTINFGGKWNPFTHTYKKASVKMGEVEERYLKRWITSIDPVGDEEGMCIEVEAADHLYQANDFIVTHNSALTSWLIMFIMSTRPMAKGVVTSGKYDQLQQKTWSELAKWNKLAINGHWFQYRGSRGNLSYYREEHPENWATRGQAASKENADAFAGLHNARSTPFYIMDEASAVPDEIYTVSEGGLTDGEPMIFLFGNPTINHGWFADTFGRMRHRWITKQIDSRTARMTNKSLIDEWITDYGDDSDFVRVRVKGQFPRVGDSQFVSTESVEQAMERVIEPSMVDPIVLGVDVARFGDDSSIITVRHGRKILSIKSFRELDLMELSARVVENIQEFKPHAVFVDGAGIGAGVVDRLRQLQYKTIEVQAGGSAEDKEHFLNKRAEMWFRMRAWIEGADIPKDAQALKYDLTGIEYSYDAKMRVCMEKKADMKKRGLPSPDYADSLALTFAEPVNPISRTRAHTKKNSQLGSRVINWRTV